MRTQVFIGFVIGGALYQAGKIALGFPPTFGTYFDSLYWGGSALLCSWFIESQRAFILD